MTKRIYIEDVRLSHPHLFTKGSYEGKENSKYTATLVLDKSNPKHIEARKQIDERLAAIYKETKTKRSDFEDKKFCVKEESSEFENSWLIKSGRTKRPIIIDRDKTQLTENDGKIYPGCYVNVFIDLNYYDKKYGKFILCNLHGVQFNRDGESLGAELPDVSNDFNDLENFEL